MRNEKKPPVMYIFIAEPSTISGMFFIFITVKMTDDAIVNLTPAEMKGVRDSIPSLITSHVDPQIKQMARYPSAISGVILINVVLKL